MKRNGLVTNMFTMRDTANILIILAQSDHDLES